MSTKGGTNQLLCNVRSEAVLQAQLGTPAEVVASYAAEFSVNGNAFSNLDCSAKLASKLNFVL